MEVFCESGKEKETFPYMSATEIRNLKKEEDECHFKSFEKKIADIWEKYNIQEELMKNGFACIYIQENSPLILSDKKTDKRLRKIVKKRRISKSKSVGKNELELDIIPKEEFGKMVSDKIFNCLKIGDKKLLRKFCKKTGYEYTMWMRIDYSPSGTINRCQYILEFYVNEPLHRDCYYNPVRDDLIIMENSFPTPLPAFTIFLIVLISTLIFMTIYILLKYGIAKNIWLAVFVIFMLLLAAFVGFRE